LSRSQLSKRSSWFAPKKPTLSRYAVAGWRVRRFLTPKTALRPYGRGGLTVLQWPPRVKRGPRTNVGAKNNNATMRLISPMMSRDREYRDIDCSRA
jgi:hypothetical protein